jgi:hypothetical protein
MVRFDFTKFVARLTHRKSRCAQARTFPAPLAFIIKRLPVDSLVENKIEDPSALSTVNLAFYSEKSSVETSNSFNVFGSNVLMVSFMCIVVACPFFRPKSGHNDESWGASRAINGRNLQKVLPH